MARVVEFQFRGDPTDLEKALAGLRESGEQTGDAVEGVGDKGKKGMDKAAVASKALKVGLVAAGAAAVAAAAATAKLVSAAIDFANRADDIAKRAKAIGTTAEELQLVQGAFELGGVAAETTSMAIQRLNVNLGQAIRGSLEQVDAFEKLGINAREFERIPLPERMAIIGDRLQNLGTQAEKAQVAQAILGRGALDMVGAFSQGGDAIRDATEEIAAAGIISNEAAEQAEDLVDAITLLKRRTQALKDDAFAVLIPTLLDASNQIGALVDAARESGVLAEFAQKLVDVSIGAALVADKILGLGLAEQAKSRAEILQERVNQTEAAVKAQRAFLRELIAEEASEEKVAAAVAALNEIKGRLAETEEELTGIFKERIQTQAREAEAIERSTSATRAQGEALQETADIAEESAEKRVEAEEEAQESIADLQAEAAERRAELMEEEQAAREAAHQADLDRIAKEEEEAELAARGREAVALALASATISLASMVADAVVGESEREGKAREEAALRSFRAKKAAALVEAGINTALSVVNAIATAPNIIAGFVMAGIAAALGGVQIGLIAAKQPPSFHTGGLVSDEVMVRARAREGVLSPQGVRAAGGERGLNDLNRGQPAGGDRVSVVYLNDRVIDTQHRRAIQRTGSPLDRAIRSQGPGVGRHNPHARPR